MLEAHVVLSLPILVSLLTIEYTQCGTNVKEINCTCPSKNQLSSHLQTCHFNAVVDLGRRLGGPHTCHLRTYKRMDIETVTPEEVGHVSSSVTKSVTLSQF